MRMRAAVWCCLMFGIISASMQAQQVRPLHLRWLHAGMTRRLSRSSADPLETPWLLRIQTRYCVCDRTLQPE